MVSLQKVAFEKVFQLAFRYPWLQPKTEALSALLFEDCDTEEQTQMVIDILAELKHITIQEYNTCVVNMALDIVTCGIDAQCTFIVAMTADSTADSGQSVIYDLKMELSKLDWSGYRSINRYDHVVKGYKEFRKSNGDQIINLVLVDNFVGSGSTVINRVNRVKKLFEEAGYPQPNIYVKVLISTNGGNEKIIKQGINFSYDYLVSDRVLERIYDVDQVEEKKELMRSIESKLLPLYNHRPLPSLGYGEAQVAISIESKNTPNNVFPIFWWKYYSDNRSRNVLLHRAMDDA